MQGPSYGLTGPFEADGRVAKHEGPASTVVKIQLLG